MAQFPGFVGPTYRSQSPYAADDRCINFYPERMEIENPKTQWALYPTPGLKEFAVPTQNLCRGSFAQDGRCFYVVGYLFLEVLADGSTVNRGTVDVNSNPATLSSSGDAGHQIMITSGRRVYIFDLRTDAFTPITDVNVVADHGGYLDGRFIILDVEMSKLRISDVDDGLTWNPLRYRLRSKAPDKWRSMIVANDVIWLFGSQTYEVWNNTGGDPFPFDPIPGALFPVGIAAPYSLKGVGGGVQWVHANDDGSGIVFQATQYAPRRISNHSVEYSLQNMASLGKCESMSYQMFGHSFWALTSREHDQTWVWDATTEMWHEALDWEISNYRPAQWTAWRPMYHAFAFDKHLVGDRSRGTIYELTANEFTGADSSIIRRVRRAPHLSFENKPLRYKSMEVDLQRGIGLSTGQGEDPQVMLRYSDDGGMTFGNEVACSAGKMGKFRTRVKFQRLGSARNRVFEVSMTDPVPWRVLGAYLAI